MFFSAKQASQLTVVLLKKRRIGMCISEGFHVFHCCLGHNPAITATLENVPSKLQGSPKQGVGLHWLDLIYSLTLNTQELFLMAFPKKNQAC